MKRNFDSWFSQFRESIADYQYYVDFDTIYQNIERVRTKLDILNSLIGSSDIESDFRELLIKHPEVSETIPLLLSKREMDIFCMDENGGYKYSFRKVSYDKVDKEYLDKICYFMKETGLFDLLSKHIINNLADYVLGVEAGLNSNGRKNRGGHLMEDLVESFIQKAGYIKNKTYFKEMYISELEERTGLDLSPLSNEGTTEKRFDFVIFSEKCVYVCECNFYASGGSKLNETARSYKNLALESKGINGFKFVWITDGFGWEKAKNNLRETFDVLNDLYCIKDLEQGVIEIM